MPMDPNTLEKLRRFRKQRRAWVSLWLLTGLFIISLFSEWIANDTPWRVRFEGRTYYPRFRSAPLPRDALFGDGVITPVNFRRLQREPRFKERPDNRIWWSPIPFGPRNTLSAEEIDLSDAIQIRRQRQQRVASLRVDADLRILEAADAEWFFGKGDPSDTPLPEALHSHLRNRLANQSSPAFSLPDGGGRFEWSLSAYEVRARPQPSVRILLREIVTDAHTQEEIHHPANEELTPPLWWRELPAAVRAAAEAKMEEVALSTVAPLEYADADGRAWRIHFDREIVQFPFRPLKNHPFGLDDSGRDVLVLVLYATRISLLFGFILVITSMLLGTLLGALQGYFGGWFDLIMQRLIEIYSSIPFLYVMILLAAVYGTSFWLLLFVYAIFNWIGISYYMRAEYLRLRSQPFTEAARALGLPNGRIMWRHILPNALVPLITFFPFMLVGAIGSLSSLDYIGFGLPPGTPSWGDLLRQAQIYRHAWWLITYPSLALFIVILLSVFIGEGLRAAFDPKRETHWEA